MLNDFSWNMTGYIPKHAVNPSDDVMMRLTCSIRMRSTCRPAILR